MSFASQKPESVIIRFLSCLIIAGLTAGYLQFHAETHTPENLSSAAEHLLQGQTHWITFQNRLLSPALINGISFVTGISWLHSFQVLIAVCLGGGSAFLLWRSWKNTGNSFLGIIESIAWFSLAFLVDYVWSYPWDYTGAVLFLLVMVWAKDCFHVLADLKSWRLGVLLVLMILNRESSLIVLAGLMVAAFSSGFYTKEWHQSVKTTVLLSLTSLTNVVWVIYIRHALFKTPTRPSGTEGAETAAGNFNVFIQNIWNLAHPNNWKHYVGMAIMLSLFLASAYFLWVTLRDFYRFKSISLEKILARSCFCIASLAIVIFADALELRVYFEIIPVAILLVFESRPSTRKLG